MKRSKLSESLATLLFLQCVSLPVSFFVRFDHESVGADFSFILNGMGRDGELSLCNIIITKFVYGSSLSER